MQTQKKQSKEDHHSYETDSYGWLTKLNLVAIAIFGLAFLMVDEDAKWLCGIAIFFSFIFIFVLNALTEQQRTITFQQRQITDLIKAQQCLQEQNSIASSITGNDSTVIVPNVYADDQIVTSSTMPEVEILHTENSFQDDLFKQTIPEKSPQEQQAIYSDIQTPEDASHIHAQANHQNDAQTQSELLIDDSESIKQQAKQDSTLIKDLKGMTSLWSAFVDWFKGGNSIVRMGIIVLLIGVILLLRFASEYWQPTLSTKLAGVAVAGMVMTGIGYWLRNKRHGYAISVQGAGLGVLYLVLFSAFKLAVITSVTMSYGLLILLLAVTLLLALRQNALILAFIALGSGFIAPFILNTGSNNIPALFTYYLALNTALAVIAFFKPWRILNTISLLATFGVGGLSLWTKAEPAQYTQLTILVWLHFALYLFISIRYSLNISKYKIAFKNVPLIDTALIFATPFMAFTMYAGLVYQNPRSLSWASAVLAIVYFAIGYILHKKYNRLSLLIQSFYGLGLTFFALILPFAFNAQWTSTGWAVQAIALIWIGCRHHLRNSLLFGLVLLGLSTFSWMKGILLDGQMSLLAVIFLSISYLAVLYIFNTPQLNEKTITEDGMVGPKNDHPQIEQSRLSMFVDSLHDFAKVGCFIALQVIVMVYSNSLYTEDIFSHNAIFMLVLTIISAVLAWRIYQIHKEISNPVQMFTGFALLYFAMIPVMLWQGDIISMWWTVQAVFMLIVASLKGISSIRKGASILLLASSVALIAAIFDSNAWRYLASGLLVMGLAINSYWLWYKARPETVANDRLLAHFSLLLSFLFFPYLANKLFDSAHWDIISVALPMLIWWGILTLIYQYKRHFFDPVWMLVSFLVLGLSAIEIATVVSHQVDELQLWTMPSEYKLSIFLSILLWGVAFTFCLKIFKLQLNKIVAQGFTVISVLLLAVLGGVIAWNELSFIPLLLLLPVVMLLGSLKVTPLKFLKPYWIGNIVIAVLGLVTVWMVSFLHDGQWNLFYLTLFNPLDMLSIGIFTLCLIAVKPLIEDQPREVKIASTAVLIITGLIVISSVMLRSLHHYLNLPYWSIEAWHNGVVQASLTILWVVLALVLTTVASKKALRYVWMVGIAVLALVIAKLIFLDLSHTHTITRIVSFIGSGLVMLVIGYFAPLPPSQNTVDTES